MPSHLETDMSCNETKVSTFLSSNEYPHLDEAKIDVVFTLKTFGDLQMVVERCAHQNDRNKTEKLVTLKGTIPVNINDSNYNIPLQVYLLKAHPIQAPLVFVRPSRSMVINTKMKTIDKTGLVSHPYLRDWKSPRSNTHTLINHLCEVFSENCPVYSKLKRSGSSKSLMRSLSSILSHRSDGSEKKNTRKAAKQKEENPQKITMSESHSCHNRIGSVDTGSECSSARYSPVLSASFEDLLKSSLEQRSCPETPCIRTEDIRSSSSNTMPNSSVDLWNNNKSHNLSFSLCEDAIRLSPSTSKSSDELASSFELESIETPRSSIGDATAPDQGGMSISNKESFEKVNGNFSDFVKGSVDVLDAVVLSNPAYPRKESLPKASSETKTCPYSTVGCQVKFGHKSSINHIEESVHHHMNLMLIKTNSLVTEMRYLEMRYIDAEKKLKERDKELDSTKSRLNETKKKAAIAEERLSSTEIRLEITQNEFKHADKENSQAQKSLIEHEKRLEQAERQLHQTKARLKESEVKLSVTKEILCTRQQDSSHETDPYRRRSSTFAANNSSRYENTVLSNDRAYDGLNENINESYESDLEEPPSENFTPNHSPQKENRQRNNKKLLGDIATNKNRVNNVQPSSPPQNDGMTGVNKIPNGDVNNDHTNKMVDGVVDNDHDSESDNENERKPSLRKKNSVIDTYAMNERNQKNTEDSIFASNKIGDKLKKSDRINGITNNQYAVET